MVPISTVRSLKPTSCHVSKVETLLPSDEREIAQYTEEPTWLVCDLITLAR